ncbi:arylesterase [Thalassomonas viridans]|uniref:Arylesterase n=1 Tax=Thalassomonas viridans TaxID=137584 RepID=A0AAE9Z703_9GAMM|nr:arylesterase [Thalassomonas viridans]WDE07728.1 arylesterase [Thalassomonas viridans]
MIKNTFFTLLIFCLLTLSAQVKATSSIVLLGDSLSASYGMQQNEGWVSILNQQLRQQNASFLLTNASISGETTAGGLSRLPGILSKEKVDYLLIELGGNDGLRGFPLKLIKNNLLQIIQLAKAKDIPVAIMNIRIPPNYGPRYNQLFTDIFAQVAKEENIPLLQFFMESIATNPKLMQADGIHPNQAAQPLIVEVMHKQLHQLLQDDSQLTSKQKTN